MTDPAETLKLLRDTHEAYLVSIIEEDKISTSDPEDKLHVHVTTDEGENVRPNENSKTSEFTYHKKDANTDTSAYVRLFNALKKLDTSYYPTMPRMRDSIIKVNYKVNRDTRVIPIFGAQRGLNLVRV